jgi:Fe-S cluster biogenesis protein NfuA
MRAAVDETLEMIRPALQADGGDIRVVDLREDTGVLDVELLGACGGCPMSTMTLKAGVERILKDRVEGLTEVRALGIDFGDGVDDQAADLAGDGDGELDSNVSFSPRAS